MEATCRAITKQHWEITMKRREWLKGGEIPCRGIKGLFKNHHRGDRLLM